MFYESYLYSLVYFRVWWNSILYDLGAFLVEEKFEDLLGIWNWKSIHLMFSYLLLKYDISSKQNFTEMI